MAIAKAHISDRRLSLHTQLLGLAFAAVAVALIGTGAILFLLDKNHAREQLQQEMTSTATLMANRSSAALVFQDNATAQENLGALQDLANIASACLYDNDQQLFASYNKGSAACNSSRKAADPASDTLTVVVPVISKDGKVGDLELSSLPNPLAGRIRAQIVSLALALGMGLAISMLLVMRLQRKILDPIADVHRVAVAVSSSGDHSLRVPESGASEVVQLAASFNAMLATIGEQTQSLQLLNQDLESRVDARTLALSDSNSALSQALKNLQAAQTDLLQKDKLASLGALVAGVAHELNTPIGNSILVASSLETTAAALREGLLGGNIKKSEAVDATRHLTEGCDMLTRNLVRAGEMIANFKQVAVDQTSEKRRTFDLAKVVQEVVDSLRHQFKGTPHRLAVDVPAGITMDSYPGPLGQVITNLVMNSLVHAFDPVHEGVLTITAETRGADGVRLSVNDNGCGISQANLSKVFDPFFTTKFGQGGSGLGLNIVYNIVTGTLGGTIEVSSTLGTGSTFTMRMPKAAPTPAAEAEYPLQEAL